MSAERATPSARLDGRADARHEAKISAPADHDALLEVAKGLHLSVTRYWLATSGSGAYESRLPIATRFPKDRSAAGASSRR